MREIVPTNGSDPCSHGTYLDLSFPRKLKAYDKLGCKLMLKHFRTHFGWRSTRAIVKRSLTLMPTSPMRGAREQDGV